MVNSRNGSASTGQPRGKSEEKQIYSWDLLTVSALFPTFSPLKHGQDALRIIVSNPISLISQFISWELQWTDLHHGLKAQTNTDSDCWGARSHMLSSITIFRFKCYKWWFMGVKRNLLHWSYAGRWVPGIFAHPEFIYIKIIFVVCHRLLP